MTALPTQDADRDDGATKASPQAKAAKRVVRRAATRMMVGIIRLIEMILNKFMVEVGDESQKSILHACGKNTRR